MNYRQGQLYRLGSDLSNIFTHLIRRKEITGRKQTDDELFEVLCRILGKNENKPQLKGNHVGWYASCAESPKWIDFKNGNWKHGSNSCDAVCFTETTLDGLRAHRKIYQSSFGISFKRKFIISKGGNPCINIQAPLLKKEMGHCHLDHIDFEHSRYLYNYIPNELHYLVNIINDYFDSTHEREWRIKENLEFDYEDIFILLAPRLYFSALSNLTKKYSVTLFDLDDLENI